MKNSIKDIQALKNNDEIANAYDHLTPPNFPIAYKAKKWFFYGLPFLLNKNVLVPRADTEVIVQEVLKHADSKALSIFDLCTGSGCIAITLAQMAKSSTVYASDISKKALKVARKNAKFHDTKIRFFKSDLFEQVFGQFDIIVSNPPYIKTVEIGKHDASILHEPRLALDGGADGLEIYRRIVADAPGYLVSGGYIFLEVGDKLQAQAVKNLLQTKCFNDITIVKDRVVYAKKTC